MTDDSPLSRINALDRINAFIVSLVTPEMKSLNAARKRNGYGQKPTFATPAPMPFDFAKIGGVKIRYAHSPAPQKPTLVMLCAFPQSIMGYASIWEALAERYNLYAYDMPGFGRSEGGEEFMSFKAQGDYLQVFLEHFGIGDVHLLGPDVGMPAILYYVGTHTNTVKSVIVGDGPGISPSSNASVIRKVVNSRMWRLIFTVAGSGTLIEAARRICYVNYVPNETELSDYKKSYSRRVGTTLKWFEAYPTSLASVDPLIEKISQPALIFWGDEDAILYADNGERLHKRLQNSELKVFKSCGHLSYSPMFGQFPA